MLKFKVLVVLLISVVQLYSQNKNEIRLDPAYFDSFIYEIKGADTKAYFVENSEEVESLKNFLSENVYLIQFKSIPSSVTDKLSNYPRLTPSAQNTKFEPTKFNPLAYGLEKTSSSKRIHIDGTNYVLFINPIEE